MADSRDPTDENDELHPEYDLAQLKGGVRGKYFSRYRSRLPLVRLEADVAEAFPTADAVNGALRMLVDIARRQPQPASTERP